MAELRCSFCGKRQDMVARLIAGGARPGTFICDECVRLCAEIVAETLPPAPPDAETRSPRGLRSALRWPWWRHHLAVEERSIS